MPVCPKCGDPMSGTVQHRLMVIERCDVCGINADAAVDIYLEIVEVDEGVREVVADMLLPWWVIGKWEDMSLIGMDDKHTFFADCPGRASPALRLAKELEESCDYSWRMVVKLVGSKAERKFGGGGA